MIKRLRRKFIIINMSLVALVLLIVFGTMLLTSIRQMQRQVEQTLTETLNGPTDGGDEQWMPRVGMSGDGKRRTDRPTLSAFSVLLDSEGGVSAVFRQNLIVGDEVVAAAVAQALDSGSSTGRLPDYELGYAIRYSSAGTRLAFVDMSGRIAELERQAGSSLVIGFFGLLAFFGISVFLSSVALRPVERAWEQQRQFVANASHELKTPLTVILANTDILLSHAGETVENERRWVENTKAEGLRMKGLVDELLYLARADIAAPVSLAPTSLSDAVWSAALPFEAVAFERGVTLSTEVADNVTVCGNEGELKQLVAILLDNAIKYAGANGAVSVRLTNGRDGTRLSVHNTGAPIDAMDLPHVFERFYRAEASRDRASGGYGLGLAIAERIAGAHRASIGVTSDAATGTTFFVEWRGRGHGKEE